MPQDAALLGLTSDNARIRLAEHGPNALPESTGTPVWRQLLDQLTHFFAAMLWAAGILAIVGGLPELGVAIFVVIVVNGLFAFAQEYPRRRQLRSSATCFPARSPSCVTGYRP